MSETQDFSPAADRIEGAKAIAAFYGITERQVRWRIDRGLIPHAREGERVVASKKALIDHWRKATGGNVEGLAAKRITAPNAASPSQL